MQLDMMIAAGELNAVQEKAKAIEAAGFANMWFTETGRSAYLSCAAAGLATSSIGIGTGIAVAFPRSPMVTAATAYELAEATNGRFTLGLGTQVKGHIERRYSADYAPPGPRLKEYIQAVQAIFRAFRGEEKLDFDGDFYHFNLLPAQWSPGPIDQPNPPIYASAVLPWMSRMAGEVCDGIHIHPFNSATYIVQKQLPHVQQGVERARRALGDITLEIPVMTAVGDTDEELHSTREQARRMIAFYGSTRTYSPVFEVHGFEGLSDQLHALQRDGNIAAMVALISDDILDHYIVSGSWSTLGGNLLDRYRDVAPNLRLMSYTAADQLRGGDLSVLDKWADVVAAVAAG